MTDKKWQKVDRAFAFFTEKSQKDEAFALADIAAAGWALSTVSAYLAKRWGGILVPDGAGYRDTMLVARRIDLREGATHNSV